MSDVMACKMMCGLRVMRCTSWLCGSCLLRADTEKMRQKPGLSVLQQMQQRWKPRMGPDLFFKLPKACFDSCGTSPESLRHWSVLRS